MVSVRGPDAVRGAIAIGPYGTATSRGLASDTDGRYVGWSVDRPFAQLFFGRATCVARHAVAGPWNEMFSDFQSHRIGGPQLAPVFGVGTGNAIFDGPGENEDFGFEQTEGDPALRYTFRTAPLRNLKAVPAFFHNGAFGTLEAAIAHHLDVQHSLRSYDPDANNVPPDLWPVRAHPGSTRGFWCRSTSLLKSSATSSTLSVRASSTGGFVGSVVTFPTRCRAACRSKGSRGAGNLVTVIPAEQGHTPSVADAVSRCGNPAPRWLPSAPESLDQHDLGRRHRQRTKAFKR